MLIGGEKNYISVHSVTVSAFVRRWGGDGLSSRTKTASKVVPTAAMSNARH